MMLRCIEMLKLTEINDVDQFFELENEWNKLLERSKDDSIFLTWESMSTYVKSYEKEIRLRILCIKDKNRLIGIAPLRQSNYNFSQLFGYEVIEPLTYRNSDYTGLILAEKEEDCLKLIINYLFKQRDWDFIYMLDIPETSLIFGLLPKISGYIPPFELAEGKICPYISLPSSMDVLLSQLSAKFRKNLRRSIKNLQKDYGRVELKKYDKFSSVEEAMNLFFELHQKRWTEKNMPGVYNTAKTRDISLEIAKRYAERGWLALYFLTLNDEPVAAQYCLEYKQRVHYGLGGFNPVYSQYSVGNIIIAKVLEECIKNNIKEYDFMKGDESYKFCWSSKYRRNMGIKFVNKSFSSKLFHWGIRTAKKANIDKIIGNFSIFDQ